MSYLTSSGHLWSRVDGKLELRLFAIIHRKTFHKKGSEARTSTTTKAVEDQESLQTTALVRKFANAVQNDINNLLSDGVVTTSIVVGGILFSGDQLLWVEQLTVGASAYFVNDGWFQIYVDGTRNVLARATTGAARAKRLVRTPDIITLY